MIAADTLARRGRERPYTPLGHALHMLSIARASRQEALTQGDTRRATVATDFVRTMLRIARQRVGQTWAEIEPEPPLERGELFRARVQRAYEEAGERAAAQVRARERHRETKRDRRRRQRRLKRELRSLERGR